MPLGIEATPPSGSLSASRPTSAPAGSTSNRPPSQFRALAGGLTPVDGASASQLLAKAYQAVTGSPPSQGTLDLLWAQWALETSRGQAMYGNNFGGIKAGRSSQGALLVTREGHGASERTLRDRFRTYATAEQGAHDYVALLARRFPAAFDGLRAGNVDAFARGLHQGRYFTAHPTTYRNGLDRLAAEHRHGGTFHGGSGNPFEQMALEGLRWAIEKASERE